MKVFLAGATGVMGKRLVPLLVARGHWVGAMTRSQEKAEALRAVGADPVVADALDANAVMRAVARSKPEVVVHQLTSLARMRSLRRFDDEMAVTNRLRTQGMDNLLKAARAAGARRFVAQSYTGWPYARDGGAIKTEEDVLDPSPPDSMKITLEAIRYLETAVAGATDLAGLVLRYGPFYGPGTSIGVGGQVLESLNRRQFPLVGQAGGIWSFVHLDDAAVATLAAIERGAPGLYNIVDDDPAPVALWLPELARIIGARPPLHVPPWLGRLAVGEAGVSMMTAIRGASNAKAKRELNWRLAYPSWREGFRRGLGEDFRPAPSAENVLPAPPA